MRMIGKAKRIHHLMNTSPQKLSFYFEENCSDVRYIKYTLFFRIAFNLLFPLILVIFSKYFLGNRIIALPLQSNQVYQHQSKNICIYKKSTLLRFVREKNSPSKRRLVGSIDRRSSNYRMKKNTRKSNQKWSLLFYCYHA